MQQIAVVTLGTTDRQAARRFYLDGFGWSPVFDNDEIMFFQMNGLMLGIWDSAALAADMQRPGAGGGAMALAHNLPRQEDVAPLMERLVAAGGTLLRAADAPVHGGFRGYVADPDGHAWEIAWNPSWSIDAEGRVTFGV
ncbi:VOC family protein [Paracoccus tibetensis]|uniref:VOC domain-containing protein n=1 Tax=Paracoccus tibetensis TaxID=336292 RepID=A0A1G5EA32_9RHOB|nr:VOC family protein [Paracoccus tibetensis]SCY23755.1 hypothetical protein SAMN05660710_01004 [Paracoccus tibetensis]